MPNKRSDQKKIVSTYVDEDLKERLRELAEREGKTITDIVTELIQEKVEHENHRIRRPRQ